MSKAMQITNRGGGFITVTQEADRKQLNAEQIEKAVNDAMPDKYVLQAVNNATDSKKVNPRMREHSPDERVYTLMLASKVRKP
jgi:hypothetical protein